MRSRCLASRSAGRPPFMTRRLLILSALVAALLLAPLPGSVRPGRGAPGQVEPLQVVPVRIVARIGGDTVRSTGVVFDGPRGRILTTTHSIWGATSIKLL